jgi:hypothetical protein
LWRTDVTPAGVERLRASRPTLEIVLGDEEAEAGKATSGAAKGTTAPAPR